MQLANGLLRAFFYLLYHNLAWSYDLVAGLVSLGRWKDWVASVLPYIAGGRVLELGHGPGHLQQALLEAGYIAVGLDESRQMGKLANQRLASLGYTTKRLVRGKAQRLALPSGAFDTVVATFPSEYIFDPHTLAEVQRTLRSRGRFVLLPVAWITGESIPERFLAWTFRVTGQAPDIPPGVLHARMEPVFSRAGFELEVRQEHVSSDLVLIVLATKLD